MEKKRIRNCAEHFFIFCFSLFPGGSGENSPSASSTLLCTVEDLCHITVRHESSPTEIEISRKTGIPLYFKFRSGLECLSFLSHLTGYYRLCEKWSFSLCNDVVYPRLKYNAANNVHGPLKMGERKNIFKPKILVVVLILRNLVILVVFLNTRIRRGQIPA